MNIIAGKVLEFAVNMSMLFNGDYKAQFTTAASNMQKLADNAKKLQAMTGKVEGFRKQQDTLERTRQKLVSSRENLRKLRTEYRNAQNPTAAMKAQVDQAARSTGKLEDAFQRQRQRLSELNSELVRSGINTSRLNDEQGKLAAQSDRVRAAQDRLTQAQQKFASIRGQFSWGNMKSDILTSAGLLMTLKAPVTVSMNYEQAMSQVRAVANPNSQEWQALREQSLELGRTTQFSAIQAANSQENLARAGFNVQNILAMMPEVLNVAASDGMELSQAAEILGGSLRGFNLKAEEARRISDTLAYISANTPTNVRMAGAALQGISGTALLQKISLEQAASYIGILAQRANLQGEAAATSLSRSISALAMRKGKGGQELAKYGIAVREKKTGNMRLLEDIVKELYEKTAPQGSVEQQAVFMRVFGQYGEDMLKFYSGIASGELEELQRGLLTQKLGSAERMARLRNDNLSGDLTGLSSAWEGFMESVGNPLQGLARSATQTLTDLINGTTSLIKELGPLSDIVIQIGAGFAAWEVIKTVYKYAGLAKDMFVSWRELRFAEQAAHLATMGSNTATLGANMAGAATSAGLFSGALSSVMGWLPLIVTASVAIWQNWEKITEWCNRAGEAIRNFDTGKISQVRAGKLQRSDPDYGMAVMSSTYQPPEIGNAEGGIYTRPIWTWAAEDGAEAIVPLTDKSRGVPLALRALEILGVTPAMKGAPQSGDVSNITSSTSTTTINQIPGNIPNVNLTVYVQGSVQDDGAVSRIKQAVLDAMEEIMSYRERVAYA